jgi:hypothetical protein
MATETVPATAEGGLATNPDGTLAEMPRALAHNVNGALLDVVALLRVARHEAEYVEDGGGDDDDDDLMTSGPTRVQAMTRIAEDKVREVIGALSPYV